MKQRLNAPTRRRVIKLLSDIILTEREHGYHTRKQVSGAKNSSYQHHLAITNAGLVELVGYGKYQAKFVKASETVIQDAITAYELFIEERKARKNKPNEPTQVVVTHSKTQAHATLADFVKDEEQTTVQNKEPEPVQTEQKKPTMTMQPMDDTEKAKSVKDWMMLRKEELDRKEKALSTTIKKMNNSIRTAEKLLASRNGKVKQKSYFIFGIPLWSIKEIS